MVGPRVRRPRVHSFRLPNGLEVLLAPLPSSPTVSVWVWYRVGSKNEWPGITGASHWVEHMLFEGSPRYPKGAIDRAVVSVGGEINAFTSTDFTAYFTTVPREHLSVPLDIESDRMTRASITPEEVARERTVIHSEREGNENWPEFRVEEELFQLAFRFHPYRWDPLGRREDIERLTAEELRQYYQRFYGTRNAVLVVSGGFGLSPTAEEIRRRFASLPETGEDPTVRIVEPPSAGERRTELSGPGTTPYLEVGWRAPAVDDATTPSILVLDTLLGGETGLFSPASGWGRSREHPSSRLYRALVDPGLAVRAVSEWRPRLHPGLFTVQVQAARGVSLDRIEKAVDHATERLAREGPTPTEMAEVRIKMRRGAALSYEGASRTGFRLGYFSMLDSPRLEDEVYRKVLRVKPSEVTERARELFAVSSRTVVRFEPSGEGHHG